jgi:hypothetical protein
VILLILPRGMRRLLGASSGWPSSGWPDPNRPDPEVTVLEPAALSAPGWAHDPDEPGDDRLVADGVVYPARQVTAVITALDAVTSRDLPHVVAADRRFVAAEMTAFLRSWLRTLTCPVLDRPTVLALSGSAGDPAVWSGAAAEVGVADRQATPAPRARTHAVTVVAGQVVGPAPESALRPAAGTVLALTQAAGVTAAHLTFTDDGQLNGAAPWWYRPTPAALRALLAHARELS